MPHESTPATSRTNAIHMAFGLFVVALWAVVIVTAVTRLVGQGG